MTGTIVHVWRLLKWGRVLARHGALRGIEHDPNTPPPVRRLARIARFGARVPKVPTYAEAFQEIGPAAIKFGQALATRQHLLRGGVEVGAELRERGHLAVLRELGLDRAGRGLHRLDLGR